MSEDQEPFILTPAEETEAQRFIALGMDKVRAALAPMDRIPTVFMHVSVRNCMEQAIASAFAAMLQHLIDPAPETVATITAVSVDEVAAEAAASPPPPPEASSPSSLTTAPATPLAAEPIPTTAPATPLAAEPIPTTEHPATPLAAEPTLTDPASTPTSDGSTPNAAEPQP